MTTLISPSPPRAAPGLPTATGGQPIYSVAWEKRNFKPSRVHGVLGRTCRVTLCALDFIQVDEPYVDAAITCLICLAKLGDLRRDRIGDR